MRSIATAASRFLVLGLAFLLCSHASVHAKTVGILMTGDIPYYHAINQAFLDEISPYLKEQNIEVVTQTPLPNPMAWTNAARKLKALGAEAIVTYGLPATLATMKEAGNTPVVFAGVFSPETMDVGGKNTTGISSTISLRTVLRHLKTISKSTNIGIIFNKTEKDSIIQAREVKKLEKSGEFTTVLMNVSEDLNMAKISTCDALIVTSCSAGMCQPYLPEIVKLAHESKVPTVALISGAESMIVLTFSPTAKEQGRKSAEMLRRILSGESPGNIPVQNPEEIEIIVNATEAKSMGIEIPEELRSAATRVIE